MHHALDDQRELWGSDFDGRSTSSSPVNNNEMMTDSLESFAGGDTGESMTSLPKMPRTCNGAANGLMRQREQRVTFDGQLPKATNSPELP